MNAAYDKLCEHLINQNIGFWSRSEDLSICTDFRGEIGTYRIFARVDADDRLFQVFGHSPVRVPPGSRPVIAEAVARINCGLKVGKFEMDCDEGELRFQAAQILPDDDLDEQTLTGLALRGRQSQRLLLGPERDVSRLLLVGEAPRRETDRAAAPQAQGQGAGEPDDLEATLPLELVHPVRHDPDLLRLRARRGGQERC